jgi:hypothetical protein
VAPFTVRVEGELVSIPYRIYNAEPVLSAAQRLLSVQQTILACLYTRHHNGHVRQRHLETIVGHAEDWVAPFVVQLLGEYVVQIVLAIQHGLVGLDVSGTATAAIIDRSDLAQLIEAYGVLREVLPDPAYTNARSYVQDVLLQRAATIAQREKFDANEIRALLANGTPIMRVMVLGLMGGDPSLADAPSLAEAIAKPATRTEQFAALQLAHRLWERFTKPEQAMIRSATLAVPISKNSRRWTIAEKIRATSADQRGA